MRRFIVMNPNLSVGRQGDVVTADQLKMDDRGLDAWVAANHGIEIDETPVGFGAAAEIVDVEGETLTIFTEIGDDYDDIWDDEPDED